MTEDLRLHYAPDNASLCVRLALLEMGQQFQTILVDRRTKGQKSPAFLALNPNGLIPVLETPQGAIFETGAILLWLADRKGQLMPGPEDAGRGDALKWLFWLSNTCHTTLRSVFYPRQYSSGPAQDLTCSARMTTHFDLLEAAPDAGWLDQSAPSVMACYCAPMLRWSALYGADPSWFDLHRWPRLLAFAQRFEQRPAAVAAAKAEGLGPTPFSAPQLPNPPEGSAV